MKYNWSSRDLQLQLLHPLESAVLAFTSLQRYKRTRRITSQASLIVWYVFCHVSRAVSGRSHLHAYQINPMKEYV